MKIKIKNMMLFLLAVLPAIVTACVMRIMPDNVPFSFVWFNNTNLKSKYELFCYPIFILLALVIFYCIIWYNRRKRGRVSDERTIAIMKTKESMDYIFAFFIMVVANMIQYLQLYSVHTMMIGQKRSIVDYLPAFICVLVGMAIIVAGNIQPKMHDYKDPVKTKWSNVSECTWRKSNHFAGVVFVICGFSIIIEAIILRGIYSICVMFVLIIIAAIVAAVYSEMIYRKNEREQ